MLNLTFVTSIVRFLSVQCIVELDGEIKQTNTQNEFCQLHLEFNGKINGRKIFTTKPAVGSSLVYSYCFVVVAVVVVVCCFSNKAPFTAHTDASRYTVAFIKSWWCAMSAAENVICMLQYTTIMVHLWCPERCFHSIGRTSFAFNGSNDIRKFAYGRVPRTYVGQTEYCFMLDKTMSIRRNMFTIVHFDQWCTTMEALDCSI